jgi:hypothetical protein
MLFGSRMTKIVKTPLQLEPFLGRFSEADWDENEVARNARWIYSSKVCA